MRRAGILLLLALIGFLWAVWVAVRPHRPPSSPPSSDPEDVCQSPVDVALRPPNPGAVENVTPPPPDPPLPDDGTPGPLRLADDAARKQGDFWLEQTIQLAPALPEGPLLDLYLSVHAGTLAGTRLRLTRDMLRLERVGPLAGETEPQPEELAETKLVPEAAEWLGDQALLGVMRKGDEWTVWWNGRVVLTLPKDTDVSGSTGVRAFGRSVRLLEGRVLPLSAVDFQDNFMRSGDDQTWRPWTGRWELTALAFPERSANPFSMRASFDGRSAAADRLYEGRTKGRDFGLGVQLGSLEGTLRIERITGGSPAARAGLQEDDTLVALNGRSLRGHGSMLLRQLFGGGFDSQTVRLRVHRPGEARLLDVPVRLGEFDWGTPLEGQPLQPVRPDGEALVVAGEGNWSEYAAEVSMKMLGAGGGGLAIAVTSPKDLLLLRWNGPSPDGALPREGLQLIRRVDGREEVLAENAIRCRPYEFYRLGLDWQYDRVTATVDGVRVFDAQVPGLRRGPVGLYARRGDPVFFDDVRVATRREVFAAERKVERKVNAIFAREEDMESWANPELEWLRDERTPWAVHAARFPGEQVVIVNAPRFDALTLRPLLRDAEAERLWEGAPVEGPQAELHIEKGRATLRGAGWEPAMASLPDGPVRRIALRASPSGGEADIDGVKLVARGHAAAAAGTFGDRVAILGLKNLGAAGTVRVSSSGTLEYTFDRAPVDWKVESGRWGLLNKWICDPRWSWFGGRTETIAALWNKRLFRGDQSIEVNVALMMRRDEPPYDRAGYERGGDFNLVLCGDGTNLHSGYSLICGGDGNRWTRLYRNGQPVAESLLEAGRFPGDRIRQPDKIELHQRWFRLRLEKRGARISFYRDGHRAFEFVDPEPLDGGRMAVWTCLNGMLLARARIAAECIEAGPLESRRAGFYDDGTVVNLLDGEVHTSVEQVPLTAKVAAALGVPADRFVPLVDDANGEAKEAAAGWSVTNGTGGGPMALQWRGVRCDPVMLGVVRFAICIRPGTAVDFCLKDDSRGDYYRWRMTGPSEAGAEVPLIGTIPGIVADGRWHVVQFDLGPSWREYWRRRGYQAPQQGYRPLIACLDNGGYAVAGFTGNGMGAAYAVSPLAFYRSSDVDHEPPRLSRAIGPYDADGDGRSVLLDFEDPGGSGVRFDFLTLVNGVAVSPVAWTFDELQQRVRVDLRACLGKEVLRDGEPLVVSTSPLRDHAGNRAAQGVTATWTCAYEAVAALPALAPEIVANLLRGGTAPQSRVLDRSSVRPLEGLDRVNVETVNVETVDDAPPWARERRSIRVTALDDGTHFGLRLMTPSFALAHWPYLVLESRMPPETPVSLHFDARSLNDEELGDPERNTRTLVLGDTGDPGDSVSDRRRGERAYLPRPAGFVQDGAWQRCEIPLGRQLAAICGPGPWTVHSLRFSDRNWLGNRKGMGYTIHAVYALPAARSDSLSFQWSSKDLVGATEFATAVDETPDTVPTDADLRPFESLENAARRVLAAKGTPHFGSAPAVKDGWTYLHVRAKNAAGAWSPVTHYKFRVDNTGPRVARTEPADGARFAGRTIRIFLDEEHGLDPTSIQVRVRNQTYSPSRRGVRYDAAENCVVFDATQVAGDPWIDGERIEVALEEATDLLGNKQVAPHRFSFVVDRAADREGPEIRKIRFCAAHGRKGYRLPRPILNEVSMALDFEETLGHVHALEDCRVDWIDDPAQAAFGAKSVRVVGLADDGNVELMLHKHPWYVDQLSEFHFDYRAEAGLKVDLQVLVMDKWYTFRFLGDGEGNPAGRIAGVVADGQWRHASVNLYDAITRAVPTLPASIVSKVRLSAHGQPGCRRGAALWLDNVMLSQAEGNGGLFEWEPSADPSGIPGYSVVIDQAPGTIPPPRRQTPAPSAEVNTGAGTWYVHVRAGDQAGNWGPSVHFRIDF